MSIIEPTRAPPSSREGSRTANLVSQPPDILKRFSSVGYDRIPFLSSLVSTDEMDGKNTLLRIVETPLHCCVVGYVFDMLANIHHLSISEIVLRYPRGHTRFKTHSTRNVCPWHRKGSENIPREYCFPETLVLEADRK